MCPKRPYKKGDRRKNAAIWAVFVPAAIVVFVVASPYLLYNSLTDTKASRHKEEKKRDDRGRFPPRLLERPRSVSFHKDESTENMSHITYLNRKAALLTLPVEIRLLIFEQLIQSESDIHIYYFRGSLRSYRCTCRMELYGVSEYQLCQCKSHGTRAPNRTQNLTPYLRICRKV